MELNLVQKDVISRLGRAILEAVQHSEHIAQVCSDAGAASLDITALNLSATVNIRRAAPEEIQFPKPAGPFSLHLTVSLYDSEDFKSS